MKKIAFILMLLASGTMLAQSVSHPVDTIYGREIKYLYGLWFDDSLKCSKNITCQFLGTFASYYNVDSADIVGIAIAVDVRWHVLYLDLVDSNLANWVESLSLLKPRRDGSMQVLANENFNILDTTRCMYVSCSRNMFDGSNSTEGIFPIYEVYFDRPIHVTDSFYISYSNKNNHISHGTFPNYPGDLPLWYMNLTCIDTPSVRSAFMRYDDTVWTRASTPYIPFMWPIIDTTGYIAPCDTFVCAAAEGPTLLYPADLEYNSAAFAWNEVPEHDRWQFSYCEAGTDPDDGHIVDCRTPTTTVYGIHDSVHYFAYVRGHCEECDAWSAWSEGFEYWKEMYHDTTGGTGAIILPDGQSPAFRLSPNPATGTVVIQGATEQIESVRIFDMAGRQVSAFGPATTFDISKLPAGSYIVRIQSAGHPDQHLRLIKE